MSTTTTTRTTTAVATTMQPAVIVTGRRRGAYMTTVDRRPPTASQIRAKNVGNSFVSLEEKVALLGNLHKAMVCGYLVKPNYPLVVVVVEGAKGSRSVVMHDGNLFSVLHMELLKTDAGPGGGYAYLLEGKHKLRVVYHLFVDFLVLTGGHESDLWNSYKGKGGLIPGNKVTKHFMLAQKPDEEGKGSPFKAPLHVLEETVSFTLNEGFEVILP